jgi:replication factor C subunit 1
MAELLSRTADSLCKSDIIEREIRSTNSWGLLPTQAIYASVIPGDAMAGHFSGAINFPAWLGKNSRRNKMDRLLQELSFHMRLT